MLRFVVLYHECPPDFSRVSHWDLMLEQEDHLLTWAMKNLPMRSEFEDKPAIETGVEAEQLAPHRLAYLDYEGAVSGGRGTVTRWDQGTYTLVAETENEITARLVGENLRGQVRLQRSKTEPTQWLLIFTLED